MGASAADLLLPVSTIGREQLHCDQMVLGVVVKKHWHRPGRQFTEQQHRVSLGVRPLERRLPDVRDPQPRQRLLHDDAESRSAHGDHLRRYAAGEAVRGERHAARVQPPLVDPDRRVRRLEHEHLSSGRA